jgi:hypothetical protein
MSGSSFLPLGNGSTATTPTDPTARLEAVAQRMERIAWMNLIVAGLLFLTIAVLLFAP